MVIADKKIDYVICNLYKQVHLPAVFERVECAMEVDDGKSFFDFNSFICNNSSYFEVETMTTV